MSANSAFSQVHDCEAIENHYESERHGMICRSELILHTTDPIYGLRNFVAHSKDDNILEHIPENSIIPEMIALILSDALDLEPELRLDPNHLDQVRICPDNPAILLVRFKMTEENKTDPHRLVYRLTEENNVVAGANAKTKKQTYLAFNKGVSYRGSRPTIDISTINLPHSVSLEQRPLMAVGIVDLGAHDEAALESDSGGEHGHVDAMAKLIYSKDQIKPVSIPMTSKKEFEQGSATVFDLICALSQDALLSDVQVINISQGFYAKKEHPVLKRVMESIDKPIICSAGNRNQDNDQEFHWPSNFAETMQHVYAVTCLRDDEGDNYWNFGRKSVTLSAPGIWGNDHRYQGTSFATAWVSRMFALAMAREGNTELNLEEISKVVGQHYEVKTDPGENTSTQLQFRTELPVPPNEKSEEEVAEHQG